MRFLFAWILIFAIVCQCQANYDNSRLLQLEQRVQRVEEQNRDLKRKLTGMANAAKAAEDKYQKQSTTMSKMESESANLKQDVKTLLNKKSTMSTYNPPPPQYNNPPPPTPRYNNPPPQPRYNNPPPPSYNNPPPPSSSGSSCTGYGFQQVSGTCIFASQTSTSFSSAQSLCSSKGGKVFEPSNPGMFNAVINAASNLGISEFWLGLKASSYGSQNYVMVSNGQLPSWDNWDNYAKVGQCVGTDTYEKKWFAENCASSFQVVCQI